jgi:chemotaxis family two-component system response regulator PixG
MKNLQLFQEFKDCNQLKYNGQLKIKNAQGQTWIFYYQLGQIVWATGGKHPARRLHRNMTHNCPNIDIQKLNINFEQTSQDYWDYQIITTLYKQNNINIEQFNTIVANTISEVLFDIAHCLNFTSLIYEDHREVILEEPVSPTPVNIFLQKIEDLWNNWSKAGLANVSPDLAPVISEPEQLRKQVSPIVYKNFERLINGKYTLWDLAVKMKQNVLAITHSLLPYIRQGIAKLVEVPDLPLPCITTKIQTITNPPAKKSKIPLIACVDDSPQVCQMLEKIITSNGMRFLKIDDPVQALPMLIQHQPDLIFLDLIMPVVNGYELCANLRRSSVFANTPIVILTGSDGVFDRVRSKVFGATEFLNKPVNRNQVLTVVEKYLEPQPAAVSNVPNLAFSY